MWFQILSCYRIRISDHNLGLINLRARLFSTKARKMIIMEPHLAINLFSPLVNKKYFGTTIFVSIVKYVLQ